MPISAVEVDFEARQLLAAPQSAVLVRTRAVQATRAAEDAARRLVAIIGQVGASLASQYQEMLDKLKDEIGRVERQIKELKAQIEHLKEQVRKLKALKEKLEVLIPAIKAAVIAEANCRVDRGIVSERTAKIRQLQEAASAALGNEPLAISADYRALLDKTRLLLQHVPVLFDIPGLR